MKGREFISQKKTNSPGRAVFFWTSGDFGVIKYQSRTLFSTMELRTSRSIRLQSSYDLIDRPDDVGLEVDDVRQHKNPPVDVIVPVVDTGIVDNSHAHTIDNEKIWAALCHKPNDA